MGNKMGMVDNSVRPGGASSRMLQMLNAFLTVQALHVVAALGIPDQMANGPAAVDDIAAATGAHPPSLYRLLRMLVGVGSSKRKRMHALRSDHSVGHCAARDRIRFAIGHFT